MEALRIYEMADGFESHRFSLTENRILEKTASHRKVEFRREREHHNVTQPCDVVFRRWSLGHEKKQNASWKKDRSSKGLAA